MTETCRKYNLAHSVLSYWKRKYLSKGKEGLKAGYRKADPKVRELEEENARLKKIIAKQALEIEVKDELLKKAKPTFRAEGGCLEVQDSRPDRRACRWADVSKSSFYYKPRSGQRGAKSSIYTPRGDVLVENSLVVDQIRVILSQDYCVYGYQVMTKELKEMGYEINKKKVYRLMKESHLLWGKRIQVQGKRKWVKHRRIEAQKPMDTSVWTSNTFGCAEKTDGIINCGDGCVQPQDLMPDLSAQHPAGRRGSSFEKSRPPVWVERSDHPQ